MRRVAAVLAYAVALVSGGAAAHAAWADTARATSGALGASTVAVPTATCGFSLLGSQGFAWAAVAGATGYRVHHGAGGATVTDVSAAQTTFSTSTPVSGGTFYVRTRHAYPSVEWTSAASNQLTYTVTALSASCS